MRLFCFGYGYVARHLAAALSGEGADVQGTSRTPAPPHIHRLTPDHSLDAAGLAALRAATHVLVSIPPDEEGGDAAYRLHHGDIRAGQWLGYLSTTGVYGDHGGAWVTEASPLRATEPRSLRRIHAERLWQGLGANCFRLAGIYGEGRNVLENLRQGTARHIVKPGHVFCRIHVEDIVQALLASMKKRERGEVYNLADDEPAASHEVLAYACGLLGQELPPAEEYDTAALSPMLRSFYAGSRRVSNRKIKENLGLSLRHPNYHEGLASILHSRNGN